MYKTLNSSPSLEEKEENILYVILLKFWILSKLQAVCLLTGRMGSFWKAEYSGTPRAFHTTDSSILLRFFSLNSHGKRCIQYSKKEITTSFLTGQTSCVWDPQKHGWAIHKPRWPLVCKHSCPWERADGLFCHRGKPLPSFLESQFKGQHVTTVQTQQNPGSSSDTTV